MVSWPAKSSSTQFETTSCSERVRPLTREQVAFWDIHEIADRDHSDVGDHAVLRHAESADAQRAVRAAVETSLAQWWQFFDGIARAIDAGRPGR